MAAAEGETEYFSFPQRCDHSDPDDSCVFMQRWVKDDSHSADTPSSAILYISGEAEMSGPPGGFVNEMAEALDAPVFSVEHRFYGLSVPGDDVTLPNLGLLTVEQALADLDAFVGQLVTNGTVPAAARWLAVGGSYAGALSSWARLKYPDTFHASWSSSGVVNAVKDFEQFDRDVAAALPADCLGRAHNLSAMIDARLAESARENALTKALFGAPASLPDTDFLYAWVDALVELVQYGMKERLCEALDTDGDLVQAFAAVSERTWGPVGGNCFYSTECIRDTRTTANVTNVGSRSWRAQKCFELAYLQAAPASNPLRSPRLTLDVLLQQCSTMFGVTPDTARFNRDFGGATPPGQSRTAYFDASDDPWKAASVQGALAGPDTPYFFINGTGMGHCIDLHAPAETDPPSLRAARSGGLDSLRSWFSA